MLIAPPFGLLAPGRAGSKDLSAFADQTIIKAENPFVKDFSKKKGIFSDQLPTWMYFLAQSSSYIQELRSMGQPWSISSASSRSTATGSRHSR